MITDLIDKGRKSQIDFDKSDGDGYGDDHSSMEIFYLMVGEGRVGDKVFR